MSRKRKLGFGLVLMSMWT